jgi:hypothetical protein
MKTCGAKFETGDKTTLTCELRVGHTGPVHRAGDSAWGDPALVDVPVPSVLKDDSHRKLAKDEATGR